MKLWKWILCVVGGGLIGAGLILILDPSIYFLILTIASSVIALYDLDQYYLEKGPQKYLKNFDQGEIKEEK